MVQAPLWGTGSALAPLPLPIQCHLLEKGCETQAHPPVIGISNSPGRKLVKRGPGEARSIWAKQLGLVLAGV